MNLPKPLLWAHRGAPLDLPENTIPAFRRGLALGASALETDLHMTADGHIVLSHDPDGRRLAGVNAEIRRSTLAEVKRWDLGARFLSRSGERFAGQGFEVPTLEELLTEFPDIPVNVDVKQREPSMVEPLLALLKKLGAEERVIIASFSSATLARVRSLNYPGRTSLGQSDVIRLLALPRAALKFLPKLGDAAQIPTRVGVLALDRPWLIEKCHALGMRVDFWTINDPKQAKALWRLGADGVMTDDPAAIAPVYREVTG